jgi:copper chaperone CopZ
MVTRIQITVTGMDCEGYEETAWEALQRVNRGKTVAADRTTDTVTVDGNDDTDTLKQVTEDAGYSGRW